MTTTVSNQRAQGRPWSHETDVLNAIVQHDAELHALALQLPAGTAPRLEVRFRTRPGATGLARFGVLSAQLRSGGQVQALPAGEPLAVRIAP